MAWAEGILAAVGTVVRVPESLLDAVTGLSGSGPGLRLPRGRGADRRRRAGRPAPTPVQARQLAVQTLLGSARLLAESEDGPEALRAAVTSPGGTTAAGLRALEAAAVRSAFLDAVLAATERSRTLARLNLPGLIRSGLGGLGRLRPLALGPWPLRPVALGLALGPWPSARGPRPLALGLPLPPPPSRRPG